jgi:biopolymer transport protein ExbD
MRIPREEESGGDVINISSLLDVIFILVIFFMATTQFRRKEFDVKVKLPQASPTTTVSAATNVIVINVRADGTYLLGDAVVSLEDLEGQLAKTVKDNPNQKVLVRADKLALHGTVAAAVHRARKAGVVEANIGYDSSGK